MISTVASMISTPTSEDNTRMYRVIYMAPERVCVPTPRGQSVVPCLSHQKDRVKPQQIYVLL